MCARGRSPRHRSKSPPDVPALAQLRRDELSGDTVALARFLVGRLLVGAGVDGEALVARIVETEAYPVADPASHAFRGRTARNGSMFLEPGFAYVYFIYGMHFCLNVSAEAAGVGAAVLLRAAEPLAGRMTMRRRRGLEIADRDLLRGPGRLARAFGIGAKHDGLDLCGSEALRLARGVGEGECGELRVGRRIGLSSAVEAPLRFSLAESPFVSGPRRLVRERE